MSNNRGQATFSKYAWVLDTIYQARKISFKELNEKWVEDDISGGADLAKRTFDNWKDEIANLFGIDIANENCGKYRYYIENESDLEGDTLRQWIYKTFSIGNTLSNCQSIKDRIVLESVPAGREFLPTIVEAMKENRVLNMTYKSYWRDEEKNFNVKPFFIKLFRQRWYLVAQGTDPAYASKPPMIYSLDRIRKLHKIGQTFEMPEDANAKQYFKGCFGIIAGDGSKPKNIKLKVSASQSNYLRDLPLHHSQKEVKRTDDYSIFTLRLRPTYDFVQELFHNVDNVEVLEPAELRAEVAEMISRMHETYKKQE